VYTVTKQIDMYGEKNRCTRSENKFIVENDFNKT
jgi:hypothetical protein